MSNKFKVKKDGKGVERSIKDDLLMLCVKSEEGLAVHMPVDKNGDKEHLVRDHSYLLASIAQTMAVKLDVDVDIIWSLAMLHRREVAEMVQEPVYVRDKKPPVEEFIKSAKWDE